MLCPFYFKSLESWDSRIYLPIDKTIKSLRLKNPLQANFFEFQNFKKTNPDAHIKNFILEKQRLEALNDIKKGIVKKKFGSGLIIFDENYDKRVKEIDSLQRKKYGFFVESTGCIIYEEDKYYNEAVDEYLQKKNGKNWENQYKKEVALIIKKYPIKEIER